jgi:hypothetical protein
MATMSRYCKAYVMPRFREFNGWSEKRENVRRETRRVDGKEEEFQRELTDEDCLFLQDNFVVTDGIFKDQNIIFDQVTDEWKQFCTEKLAFQIPADLLEVQTPEAPATAEAEAKEEATPA